MSLFVASLNSGSNGNCYYIGNSEEAVLVDGGISCRETEKRLKRLGLSIKRVKAIFITHEHGDHIHGVPTLAKKHKIPIYITEPTLRLAGFKLDEKVVMSFQPYEPIQVGSLVVHAFPKNHDAGDPHSFMISHEGVRVGVFTDIGFACDHVIRHFQQCHAAFLESNYDDDMLTNGSYPPALKNRIRGDKGHLSNKQAEQLFLEHRPEFMSHLFLSHLSRNNNTQKIVKDMFSKIAGPTTIVVATRNKETALYHIRNRTVGRPQPTIEVQQLSLF